MESRYKVGDKVTIIDKYQENKKDIINQIKSLKFHIGDKINYLGGTHIIGNIVGYVLDTESKISDYIISRDDKEGHNAQCTYNIGNDGNIINLDKYKNTLWFANIKNTDNEVKNYSFKIKVKSKFKTFLNFKERDFKIQINKHKKIKLTLN